MSRFLDSARGRLAGLGYRAPLLVLIAVVVAAVLVLTISARALGAPSHTSAATGSAVAIDPAAALAPASPPRIEYTLLSSAAAATGAVWWQAPVSGATCSSPRGWRWGDWHAGRDLLRYEGAPVRAVANGTVIAAGWSGGRNGGWGYRVVLLHGKHTYSTLYAHGLKGSITVHVGQWVKRGTVIMRMGSSGWSTGVHTHFGVYAGRYAPGGDINPDRFMSDRGVKLCR